jgi:hypothetical protein
VYLVAEIPGKIPPPPSKKGAHILMQSLPQIPVKKKIPLPPTPTPTPTPTSTPPQAVSSPSLIVTVAPIPATKKSSESGSVKVSISKLTKTIETFSNQLRELKKQRENLETEITEHLKQMTVELQLNDLLSESGSEMS